MGIWITVIQSVSTYSPQQTNPNANLQGDSNGTCLTASTTCPRSNSTSGRGSRGAYSTQRGSTYAQSSGCCKMHPKRIDGTSKYLEMCVNSGEFSKSLGEIEMSQVQSDGCLFRQIKSQYLRLRGYRAKHFLLKPTAVQFVQVSPQPCVKAVSLIQCS